MKIGDKVVPSEYNTDPRIQENQEGIVTNIWSEGGIIFVKIGEKEDWWSEDDWELA